VPIIQDVFFLVGGRTVALEQPGQDFYFNHGAGQWPMGQHLPSSAGLAVQAQRHGEVLRRADVGYLDGMRCGSEVRTGGTNRWTSPCRTPEARSACLMRCIESAGAARR